MMNNSIFESLNLIKALSDSSRLLIICSLREKPQYVEELAERLQLAESTVSFHLKKLEAAHVVSKVKEQYYVVYHLNNTLFSLTLHELTTFENPLKIVQEKRIDDYNAKIIATYFTKGQLKKIPTQYKKRLIVLLHILKSFKTATVYSEKEVDGILKNIHEDYCSIRRYFIDERMMTRKKGNYTLNPDYSGDVIFQTQQKVKAQDKKSALRETQTKEKPEKMVDIKEINRVLKSTLPPMGVYTIKNSVTGTIFLGSSKNLKAILNRHKFELEFKSHRIEELQKTWDESGEASISFEILDTLDPKEDKTYDYTSDIAELEALWLEKLQSEGQLHIIVLKNTEIRKNKA